MQFISQWRISGTGHSKHIRQPMCLLESLCTCSEIDVFLVHKEQINYLDVFNARFDLNFNVDPRDVATLFADITLLDS